VRVTYLCTTVRGNMYIYIYIYHDENHLPTTMMAATARFSYICTRTYCRVCVCVEHEIHIHTRRDGTSDSLRVVVVNIRILIETKPGGWLKTTFFSSLFDSTQIRLARFSCAVLFTAVPISYSIYVINVRSCVDVYLPGLFASDIVVFGFLSSPARIRV